MSSNNIRFKDLIILDSEGKSKIIEWCMEKGLIANEYTCPKCLEKMRLIEMKTSSDGFSWICRTKVSNAHTVVRSIRNGSMFAESRLSLPLVLQLTYLWFSKCSNKYMCNELNLCHTTVVDWNIFCREICMELCFHYNGKIGGINKIVEINESKFDKRKYNKGKKSEGNWVYRGLEIGTNNCFFKVVSKRSKEHLLKIIIENILPGSTIISSCWKAYKCLHDEGYRFLQANHSIIFKDLVAKDHTNAIKETFDSIKNSLQTTHNVKGQFDSYLAEYAWRSLNPNIDFNTFLKQISLIYTPKTED